MCSACGASSSSDHRHGDPLIADGRRVFAASCAGCHTLTGHDTPASGGDLGHSNLTDAEIVSFTRIMPARPALTRSRIRAVAAFVETFRERPGR